MVPTSSPFADLSNADPQSAAPEEDFYLHLHLPPELDLAIPATTQIYHQPPNSYLIPRWDLGPDSGAFTRIEFPPIGTGPGRVSQEDIDTFETILAQCTAFLDRSRHQTSSGYPAEKGGQGAAPYNPQNYRPGEGYAQPGHSGAGSGMPQHGHIVLVDEENGSVVGELSEGFNVIEDPNVKHGSKNPVEIQLPQDPSSNRISVSTVPPEYLRDAEHPAYKTSRLVSNAAAASRLIVDTSGQLSQMLQSSADNFTHKTKSNPKPLTFTPTTHERVRKINAFTQGAAGLSAKTVGQVSKYAQNLGAMARRGGKGLDKDGKPQAGYKPGILNKSLIAFSTVADGIDQGARNLLTSGSTAATTVIGHRYGREAGELTQNLAGGALKNVGLVYIDAMGVSRRAVVKSVAKGMVIGRVKGGGDLVVGAGGNGGIVMPAQDGRGAGPAGNPSVPGSGLAGTTAPGVPEVGFGNAIPPAYNSGVGEPLGGTALQGQESTVKR
jgi:spartin